MTPRQPAEETRQGAKSGGRVSEDEGVSAYNAPPQWWSVFFILPEERKETNYGKTTIYIRIGNRGASR
jgi:hypothetical protein